MYIYQNGKLYVQSDGDKIIGVEIYPDKIIKVEGTETVRDLEHSEPATPYEVNCRFHLSEDNPYIFPREVNDIGTDTDSKTKTTTRKSRSK